MKISMCTYPVQVPKIETLIKLVDVLSLFKYNQLQLYFEHTFAYKDHKYVEQYL